MFSEHLHQGWRLLAAKPDDLLPLLDDWPPEVQQPLRDHAKVQAFVHQGLFVKCFRYQGLRRWAARLGRERGYAGLEAAARLRAAGIATPAGVALLQEQGLRRSWLLTELLDEAVNCHQLGEEGLSAALRQQLFVAGMELLRQLHLAGFAHGDFKWANLMWQSQAEKLWLIDLDGVHSSGIGRRAQLRDVARFFVNADELGVPHDALRQAFADYCASLSLEPTSAAKRMRRRYAKLAAHRGCQPVELV